VLRRERGERLGAPLVHRDGEVLLHQLAAGLRLRPRPAARLLGGLDAGGEVGLGGRALGGQPFQGDGALQLEGRPLLLDLLPDLLRLGAPLLADGVGVLLRGGQRLRGLGLGVLRAPVRLRLGTREHVGDLVLGEAQHRADPLGGALRALARARQRADLSPQLLRPHPGLVQLPRQLHRLGERGIAIGDQNAHFGVEPA
jgi:hypothetical protein